MFARRPDNKGLQRAIAGSPLAPRRRKPVLEHLESRTLLTVAQDLAAAIAPYQPALISALSAATPLPLVRNQLAGLPDFAAELLDTESSIAAGTQDITANGHYQISVPLPSLSKTFNFDLGLDAFLKAKTVGNVHAEIDPTLTIAFDVTAGAASLDVGQSRFDIGFGLSLPGFQGTFSLNGLLFAKAVDAGTSFNIEAAEPLWEHAPAGRGLPGGCGRATALYREMRAGDQPYLVHLTVVPHPSAIQASRSRAVSSRSTAPRVAPRVAAAAMAVVKGAGSTWGKAGMRARTC